MLSTLMMLISMSALAQESDTSADSRTVTRGSQYASTAFVQGGMVGTDGILAAGWQLDIVADDNPRNSPQVGVQLGWQATATPGGGYSGPMGGLAFWSRPFTAVEFTFGLGVQGGGMIYDDALGSRRIGGATRVMLPASVSMLGNRVAIGPAVEFVDVPGRDNPDRFVGVALSIAGNPLNISAD